MSDTLHTFSHAIIKIGAPSLTNFSIILQLTRSWVGI